MTYLEVIQAAILIINWLKANPPSDREIDQKELDEANAKMKEAVERWKEA